MKHLIDDLIMWMSQTWMGNSFWQYGYALVVLLLGILFHKIISKMLNRLLFRLFKKHAPDFLWSDFLNLLSKPVSYTILLLVTFLAFSSLSFPDGWNMVARDEFGMRMVLHKGYFVLLYAIIVWVFLRLADFLGVIMLARAEKADNKYSGQIIPFFIDFIKVIVIIFGILVLLGSVFGVNIGTLVAGLGIGGLAIALASKETLENLLGSFTIFLDKPFVVGDLVRVAGITGVIEKVGFRSTRIRTLEKSYVTLPNKKMVDTELDNLTLRTFRRAEFFVGVTYSTSIDQIKAIVADIQNYIDNHPATNSDGKVRLHQFGASSLDIMVLFFVDTVDWSEYLDVKQEIMCQIIEIVQGHGAEFAFPSTSIYIEKNANNENR
jgi:MscS family membrane protein